jgi:hypothetical protein
MRGNKCVWSEDIFGNWETECGDLFSFNAGGPTENEFRYCPYCGLKLSTHRSAELVEEEE